MYIPVLAFVFPKNSSLKMDLTRGPQKSAFTKIIDTSKPMTYYTLITNTKSIKVTELPLFQKFTKRYLNNEEHEYIKNYIAKNPLAGDVAPNSGGLRKLRFALSSNNKGKSGGIRTIHYYHTSNDEVYIVHGFLKSKMPDFTKEEYAKFKAVISKITKTWGDT